MWKAALRLALAVVVGACGSGSLLSTAFGGTWTGTMSELYTDDDGGFSGAAGGTNEQLVITVSGGAAQIIGACDLIAPTESSVVLTGTGNVATLSSETVACEWTQSCDIFCCPAGVSPPTGPMPDAGTGAVSYSSGVVTLSNATPPQLTMTLTGQFMIPCMGTSGYPEVNVTTTFMGVRSP